MVILGVLLGGLGAGMRYSLGSAVRRRLGDGFPFGTLSVNLLGAFAAGVTAGAVPPGSAGRTLALGFLGGFTTFSTWSVETLDLGSDGPPSRAVVHLVVMLLGGLAACAIGFWLTT